MICLNTKSRIIFINKVWLLKYLLNRKISFILTFLKFKKIKVLKYKLIIFALLFLYFLSKNLLDKKFTP